MFGYRDLFSSVFKQFNEAAEKVTNFILVRENSFLSETTDTLHKFISSQLYQLSPRD